uniref:Uncharacterized protein n=1 Tax=Lysobacter enzymogenes TaxID=69 RepID=A1EBU8_LYSEN|nr:unknown [Lysobacter enzymogenes]
MSSQANTAADGRQFIRSAGGLVARAAEPGCGRSRLPAQALPRRVRERRSRRPRFRPPGLGRQRRRAGFGPGRTGGAAGQVRPGLRRPGQRSPRPGRGIRTPAGPRRRIRRARLAARADRPDQTQPRRRRRGPGGAGPAAADRQGRRGAQARSLGLTPRRTLGSTLARARPDLRRAGGHGECGCKP